MAGPVSIFAKEVEVWNQATKIITVTAGSPGAVAKPTSTIAAPVINSSSSGSSAPAVSSSTNVKTDTNTNPSTGTSGTLTSSSNQICINFSGNNNFHWLNTGSWGSSSGSGTQSASQCFNLEPNAGMFICESECQDSGDAATAKYTKLECTFGGSWQNCDISLVDGFSLPLECTIPGAAPEKIGGLADLDSLTSCPSTGDDGTCKNSNAYMANAGDVAQYFQNANGGSGGNYCVYQFCSASSDSFFSGTPTIECQVGSRGSAASSKRDVDVAAADDAADLLKRDMSSHGHSHRHLHQHAHARGLKNLIG